MLKYSLFPPRTVPPPAPPPIPSLIAISNPGTESLSLLSSITVPHTSIPGIYSQRRRNGDCDNRRIDAGEYSVPDVHCSVDPVEDSSGGTLRSHLCVCVCVTGCVWTCLNEGGMEGERETEFSVAALWTVSHLCVCCVAGGVAVGRGGRLGLDRLRGLSIYAGLLRGFWWWVEGCNRHKSVTLVLLVHWIGFFCL